MEKIKIIEWSKKNYLIIILFIVAVLMWWLKIKTNNQNSDINDNLSTITPVINNKTDDFISVKPIINERKYNGKTKEEIVNFEIEEKDLFVSNLTREEIEELDMTPNYDFSDFLPKKKETFIAEKYSSEERILTVKGLIEDKDKILEEINYWLFYETGNNPRTIKIIWSQ